MPSLKIDEIENNKICIINDKIENNFNDKIKLFTIAEIPEYYNLDIKVNGPVLHE